MQQAVFHHHTGVFSYSILQLAAIKAASQSAEGSKWVADAPL